MNVIVGTSSAKANGSGPALVSIRIELSGRPGRKSIVNMACPTFKIEFDKSNRRGSPESKHNLLWPSLSPTRNQQTMPSPKKRARDNDEHAPCPFTCTIDTGKRSTKTSIQKFSFRPTDRPIDVAYIVDPPRWFAMKQHNSFECRECYYSSPRVTFANAGIVEGDTYCSGEFVFVTNEHSIKRRKLAPGSQIVRLRL